MKKLFAFLVVAALVALLALPAAAQDDVTNVIIDSTFGSGPTNFNPVTSSDASAQQIMNMLYPALVGVNPETGVIEPGVSGVIQGGVVESWEVSEDGRIYTFTLSDQFRWSDGTPLTARDYQASWDAINTEGIETPLIFLTDTVESMVAVDDYTLEVTFVDQNCEALNDAALQPIPSHLYPDGIDVEAFNQEFYDTTEALEIGPYQLAVQAPDQQTSLIPVEGDGYASAFGDTANQGYIYKVVGDQAVQIEQLLAGEIDVLDFIPPNRRADVRAAAEEGTVQVYEYSPGNVWDYFAFNLANPENPQEGVDADGNRVEQDPHPIFADVRVRQALSMAVNQDDIVEGAVFGEGSKMQSSYAPGSWPYAEDVPFYAFDPEAAAAMLEEAGWVDDDGDPATPRIAQGALNAEDGTELRFTLLTNQGNTRREAIGTLIQDQLADIGVAVDFQTIDFNVLIEQMDQQTFDAVILGWQNSYPFRADQSQLWAVGSDIFGGSNMTSYHNPELDAIFRQAISVPGCDLEERAALYAQAQQILHEDAPYIFLYSVNGLFGYSTRLDGISPTPANLYWNIAAWRAAP